MLSMARYMPPVKTHMSRNIGTIESSAAAVFSGVETLISSSLIALASSGLTPRAISRSAPISPE